MGACQANPTYLDKYFAIQPGRANGAKRLILILPVALREQLPLEWVEDVGQLATVVWRVGRHEQLSEDEMESYECVWAGTEGVEQNANGVAPNRLESRQLA